MHTEPSTQSWVVVAFPFGPGDRLRSGINDSLMNAKRCIIVLLCICLLVVLGVPLFRFIRTDSLNQAAKEGDTAKVDRLLSSGAAINGTGMHGMTPLMSACAGGDIATVRYLISRGADVNGHNASGSALMWAIDSGNVEIVHLLLDNGVDTSWKNHLGNDARSFAAEKGNDKIVNLLQ
jgi:ankyrin repeat protein